MRLFGLLLLIAFAVSGCTSKSSARAQARTAFFAGQAQGMARTQPQIQGPSVTIIGPVKNPALPWVENLTLARSIVWAEYLRPNEPLQITIIRSGQELPVSPQALLGGEDVPLLPGDVVQIR